MSLLLLRQQLKLAPSDRWIDAATLHFTAKERLAVPKKLLACNTKLKLHDRFIGYSENEAQLKHSYIHR